MSNLIKCIVKKNKMPVTVSSIHVKKECSRKVGKHQVSFVCADKVCNLRDFRRSFSRSVMPCSLIGVSGTTTLWLKHFGAAVFLMKDSFFDISLTDTVSLKWGIAACDSPHLCVRSLPFDEVFSVDISLFRRCLLFFRSMSQPLHWGET